MLNSFARILLLVVLVAGLAACGFRLRGATDLPAVLQETQITGVAEFAPLTLQLRRLLISSGATVLPATARAESTLTIIGERLDKRVLSVDVQGRAAEYELNYRYSFQVTDSKDNVLVPPQRVVLTRDFRFDPDNVLATDAEEAQILDEMYRFAARQTMRRLNAMLKEKN